MPYTQEISRQNKACFLFLLDRSYSMVEPLGDSLNRKCDELATALNGWLQNMTIRATGGEGIRDWIDVGVIGYHTDQEANPIIQPGLLGEFAEQPLVSITEVGARPARMDEREQLVPDEATGEMLKLKTEIPIWVDPIADGGTPMCHTLHYAYELMEYWIQEHPNSFPPIVVHITDGESQDGDPVPYAEALKSLETTDGNLLLFNCHLSAMAADSFMFPSSGEILPEELARVLFQMSSVLPDSIADRATAEGFELQPGSRGMVYNADMICLLQFLDMGTRIASNLR